MNVDLVLSIKNQAKLALEFKLHAKVVSQFREYKNQKDTADYMVCNLVTLCVTQVKEHYIRLYVIGQ